MKKRSVLIPLLLIVFLVLLLFFFYRIGDDRSWGPRNRDSAFILEVNPADLPKGTRFVDLLIPIDEADENYCRFNEKNRGKYGIDRDSEIVRLNKQGYQSYSFHFSPAATDINAAYWTFSFFCEPRAELSPLDFYARLEKYRSIRLAFLDESGKVLSISNDAPIYDEGMAHRRSPDKNSIYVKAKLSDGRLETDLSWDQRSVPDIIFGGFIILLVYTWPLVPILLFFALLFLFVLLYQKIQRKRNS